MKKYILLAIVLVATLLRFWQLGQNPPSLTWDEVAWGYNAYSLGIDGRDEFGRFLPVDYLESFGDFKPPVYAYLDIIPIKVFGLTEFAVRFPSALLGTLTVLLTFGLTKQIFFKDKKKDWYGLAAAGVLAVSPWHIMLSRAAFEANVATFFIGFGVWLFLKAVNENKWYLLGSVTSFVLSVYTFNSARIVSPLLLTVLFLVFWKKLWQAKVATCTMILLGILLILPTAKFLLSPQAGLRFKEVNIFSDISIINTLNQEVANDHNAWWSKIIHNRRAAYAATYLKHYFDNISPSFLFITGDGNPKFSTRDVGELYIWDMIFLLVGGFLLVKKREGAWWVLPIWFLLSIVPAATARETPHALRIEGDIPTLQILIGYGFVEIISWLKNSRTRILYVSIALLLLGVNVVYFLHGYYTHYAREFSEEWQYGYKDAIAFVNQHQKEFTSIEMTEALGRPYIYVLFYTQLQPQTFRSTAHIERDAFGFVHVTQVGKYHFSDTLSQKPNTLYINIPNQVPSDATILREFPFIDGKTSLVAYTL